jgi:alginate O-acetyltransferase complex protein AlgI
MLFNSVEFLIFFPVVTIVFFVLEHKYRWLWLLTASCFFYMFFKPVYILVLAFTIVIDYYAGIQLAKTTDSGKRKLYLILSLIANIGVLVIFKYFNFINSNITGFLTLFNFKNPIPYLSILLPIGLSFHTFQAMSYTIEVYRGNQKAERHFGIYALYVMFFPQLVAGPIERPQNILYQFHTRKYFNYENALIGLRLIAWGLFKKIVIADRLSVYVNQVYGDVDNAGFLSVFFAVLFFSIQIYADFSGYSDIARGSAKVMGYDLLINFKAPLKSRSITEFWQRWHISLSTWFRDYLYIPLGGNRTGYATLHIRNLLIVFIISGLWHGANWTFIVWGLMHGIAVIYETYSRDIRTKIFEVLPQTVNKLISILLVWFYVSISWIFFRSESIHQALLIIKKLFSFDLTINFVQLFADKGPFNFVVIIFSLILFYAMSLLLKNGSKKFYLWHIIFLVFIIIILGKNVQSEFIYFQF